MSERPAIAIVGIGCVFPEASDPSEFWKVIESARDTSREVPPERWLLPAHAIHGAYPPAPDQVVSTRGCFAEIPTMEISDLEIDEGLLRQLDPLCHLTIAAGLQAFRDASMAKTDRDRVGVVLGNIALPTDASSRLAVELLGGELAHRLLGKEPVPPSVHPRNRYVTGLPAGLLATALRLGGGSYTLDAACASSLYAIDLAARELQAGRADAMISGGVSRPSCLYTQMGFSQLTALSPTGHCSPFDHKGDGIVVGEGAGVVVLKRLDDALRQGDRIYAVLRGAGLSNDVEGRLLSPSSEGQLRAMVKAYREAGWDPADIDLVECHATGTPVGDRIEHASLRALRGVDQSQRHSTVIGSVKSNIGHSLTAAGAAGTLKVLLALQEKTLPATANFERSADGLGLDQGPFEVLARSRFWPETPDRPRRAAVSGFGFGGINAHLLFEEWRDESSSYDPAALPRPTADLPEIAIVGMAARFGPWEDLRAFQERVFGADDRAPEPRAGDWGLAAMQDVEGHFLSELSVQPGELRIPPNELREMLPQQLLMLLMAKSALADADIENLDRLATGIFIGIGLDLESTNYHLRWWALRQAAGWAQQLGGDASDPAALERWQESVVESAGPALSADRTMGNLGGIVASRVARELRIGGPSFVLSDEEASGLAALEAAVRALQRKTVDHALVGAVDLASDPRSILGFAAERDLSSAGTARPFDRNADGCIPGEGAAALVLKRHEDALRDGDRIYSVIRGIASAGGGGSPVPTESVVLRALEKAYREAAIDRSTIGYLESHGSGVPLEDRIEAEAVREFFGPATESAPVVLGSVKADIGHAGAASGLASVIKASLCLDRAILPALRGLQEPLAILDNGHSAVTLPGRTRAWVHDHEDPPRRAAVNSFSVDGTCRHVVLERGGSEPRDGGIDRLQPLGVRESALFVVTGHSDEDLHSGLHDLEILATSDEPIEKLARSWFAQHGPIEGSAKVVSMVAGSPAELARLAREAQSDGASPNGNPWRSDSRMEGELALVFPGSGSHFRDMGRELALAWPEILANQEETARSLRRQLVPEVFWGDAEVGQIRPLLMAPVALGLFIADLLAHHGVRSHAVLGYSLGETAALFASGAWSDRHEMLQRAESSELFVDGLTGSCESARKVWGSERDDTVQWCAGVIEAPAEQVMAALEGRERVHLLIVNTPGECVIGGDRTAVSELVATLEASFHDLEGVLTVHGPMAEPCAEAYRDLHHLPTTAPEATRVYSAAWARSYIASSDLAAESIGAQATARLDFPALVERAWQDGVRIFVESGPGSACTRMIRTILGSRPHLAVSTCPAGAPPVEAYLRTLGALAAAGVPVDLEALYGQESPAKALLRTEPPDPQRIVLAVGRGPFETPEPPEAAIPVEPPPTVPSSTPRLEGTRSDSDPRVEPTLPSQTPSHADREEPRLHPKPSIQHRDSLPGPETSPVANSAFLDGARELYREMTAVANARTAAHETFLRVSEEASKTLSRQMSLQMSLLGRLGGMPGIAEAATAPPAGVTAASPPAFDRDRCLEFAVGSIGDVLGPEYAAIDRHATRVRLPDEPLMLVDRILSVTGEKRSMSSGTVITEHDVLEGDWYLDGGRIPTAIAVESGQADLFLSAYLGIDFETRGEAVYRLLDATVTFHRGLPGPGEVIRYDIEIEQFFLHEGSWFFHFHFDATVGGEAFLSMHNGSAGFFTQEALDAGQGIVHSRLDRQPQPGKLPDDWRPFIPIAAETYDQEQVEALRRGDLAGCFGPRFSNLDLRKPLPLPGARLHLVDRVVDLQPQGGRYGLGLIRAEADIHPDDWFLTCHFVDDRVMPGTLMYECCLHTLRILLTRMGWVGESGETAWEPVPGVESRLKCRGQVIDSTRVAAYEISLKEIGFAPEPFAIADALMYADGKAIVEMKDMSIRLTGTTESALRALWQGQRAEGATIPISRAVMSPASGKAVLYSSERILAFAIGKPSEAFGEPYRVFDSERIIARLPGPPFQFLDRIVGVSGEPFVLTKGATCEAEVDVTPDAWYFDANRQSRLPFAVLLEMALQPCGWLAGYSGSALTSEVDLSFRNLGGRAILHRPLERGSYCLVTEVEMTDVSISGGMVIQHFRFRMLEAGDVVYEGTTYFGFFSKAALADQVGIRDAEPYRAPPQELEGSSQRPFPTEAPFPEAKLRMVDTLEHLSMKGGEHGRGLVLGRAEVNPDDWFYKAHFYQDPVWPGSLGIESFLQLLEAWAAERWGADPTTLFATPLPGAHHEWVYRGQILPVDQRVSIQASIREVDDDRCRLVAEGWLEVDGRVIYRMENFEVGLEHSREE